MADGKSTVAWSLNVETGISIPQIQQVQQVGRIDRSLKPEDQAIFWGEITTIADLFVSNDLYTKEGIEIAIQQTYANNPNIKSIMLTNVHATADATVTLFIQDDPASGARISFTSTFNILSTVAIPSDTALLLDESSIFTYGNKFGLYITVGANDTVDVMINI